MPSHHLSTAEKVAIGIAVPVGLYAAALGLLLTPYFQRFALYAHQINTLFWQDIDDPTVFGFAKHQVTPFNLQSPDGETLYAWHILPLNIYTRNEAALRDEERPNPIAKDITSTLAFKLLQSPDARVVISFHGNAGHIAQGWRTDTFRYTCTQPNTHVLTIDYRGFGKSTGSPTEAGLITDGVALVDWVLNVAKVPPERIVLLGQSLGTAVASATALRFAEPRHDLFLPASSGKGDNETTALLPHGNRTREATTFASVVLVAPFSSLPSLLLTYRIGGIFPILLPLRPIPPLARFLTNQMTDKWPTADRLAAYYASLKNSPKLHSNGAGGDRRMGKLQVIHAVNDADISYHQTEIICRRMFGDDGGKAGRVVDGNKGASVLDVRDEGRVGVRFEILEQGGHNRIVTYTPVAAAVLRAFEDLD